MESRLFQLENKNSQIDFDSENVPFDKSMVAEKLDAGASRTEPKKTVRIDFGKTVTSYKFPLPEWESSE